MIRRKNPQTRTLALGKEVLRTLDTAALAQVDGALVGAVNVDVSTQIEVLEATATTCGKTGCVGCSGCKTSITAVAIGVESTAIP